MFGHLQILALSLTIHLGVVIFLKLALYIDELFLGCSQLTTKLFDLYYLRCFAYGILLLSYLVGLVALLDELYLSSDVGDLSLSVSLKYLVFVEALPDSCHDFSS